MKHYAWYIPLLLVCFYASFIQDLCSLLTDEKIEGRFCILHSFLQMYLYMKGREIEREEMLRGRERSSMCGITPQMPTIIRTELD